MSGSAWPWMIAGALVLVVAGAYAWWRRRPATAGTGEPDVDEPAPTADAGPQTIEDLRAEAVAALVATDDAVRSSQLEVRVARTEFGEDVVEPFTAALDHAGAELDRAHDAARTAQAHAGADDERALLEQICTRCAAAGSHLDALAPRFDALRDLETRAGEVLAHLADDARTMDARLSAATSITRTLSHQFPRATIATVLEDLDHASERLRFAQECLTVGQQLLSSSDRPGAAARARAAEEALTQASMLLDSVDRSPKVLAKAQEAVTTMLAQSERDIADAERLGVCDDLPAKGQYARETLGWAGEEVSSGDYDPLEMRRALQDADVALVQALGDVRPADDTQERALTLLATAWYGARATIRAADELIMTRRAAVGLEARARLALARGHDVRGTALGDSDPPAALRHLRTADALAYQARTLAQQDEAAWLNGRRMASGAGALDTVLAGGILIEGPAAPARRVGATSSTGAAPAAAAPTIGPPSFGGPATRARRVGYGGFSAG